MKFFRRSNRRTSDAKKPTSPAALAPRATPRIGALRQDSPTERVDLSTGAFEREFPKIARRMDQSRQDHSQRRTSEQAAAQPPGDDNRDP